ncbi:MAG: TIGR04290 family methyltransferase [Caldilineaceae bacterium]
MSYVAKSVMQEIAELAPWFHNLHLPSGVETNPDHVLGDFPTFKWQQIADYIPHDLTGWRVLDIGCNAGFYSFELAKRGARVLGIDVNPHYLAQAHWAAHHFALTDQVEFRQMQIYDLAHQDETFDLVLFMGLFYHLRYPLLGLDIVTQKVTQLLIFQTLLMAGDEEIAQTRGLLLQDRAPLSEPGWPKLAFLEHEFAGDPTNWWVANRAGMCAMLRSSGMTIEAQPEREIFICRPDLAHPASTQSWNAAELLAATGQPWQQHVAGLFG